VPGTLLLADLQQANEDELRQHLNDLLNPPSPPPQAPPPSPPPDPDLMAHLGGGSAAVPNTTSVPQELQDHVDQLLAPPSSPETPSQSATSVPTPSPPQELQDHVNDLLAAPTPAAAPAASVQDLGERAGHLASSGLQVIGEGLTNLGQGAQRAASGVTRLIPPAASAPAAPSTDTNATDAVPQDTTSGRVFPVQGYNGQVDLHWGDVKGGSDLFAPRGTPIVAMEPGKVVESGANSVGGNSVLVQGDDGLQYYYAHGDATPSVNVGDRVTAGQYLMPVGDTGDAKGRGTHLHIGIGPDIRLGADKYGGTGGDYDAVGLLRSTLAPQDQQQGPAQRAQQAVAGAVQAGQAIVGQGQKAFVDTLQPLAQQVSQRTGIDPNAMLAIAANETGWGQSQNAQQQNNLFSIQGDGSNGSRWASYKSPQESFNAFVNLISSAPRYAQAWADRADPGKFVDDLRNAGYVADEPGFPAQGWVDQVKSIYRNLPVAQGASADTAGVSAQRQAAVLQVGDQTRPAARAPLYAGVMQDAQGNPVAGGSDQQQNPLQVLGDVVDRGRQVVTQVASNISDAAQGAAARQQAQLPGGPFNRLEPGAEGGPPQYTDFGRAAAMSGPTGPGEAFSNLNQGIRQVLGAQPDQTEDVIPALAPRTDEELAKAKAQFPMTQAAPGSIQEQIESGQKDIRDLSPLEGLQYSAELAKQAPSAEWSAYQQAEAARRQAVEGVNPLRESTIPGVAGVSNMALDVLTDPTTYLLGGPISDVSAAVLRRLAPAAPGLVANLSRAALEGATWGGIQGVSDPNATPESIAKSIAAGVVLAGGGHLAAQAARQAAPAIIDALQSEGVQQALRSRMPAESTSGFASGLDALVAARQAVEDLRTRFPQMSPGSLAASREGRALAELEATAAGTPAGLRPSPAGTPTGPEALGVVRLDQALKRLDAYPEDTARPVRAWATSTDATPSEVARTVEQWIAENPAPERRLAQAPSVGAETRPTAGFRAPTMAERPSTVSGTAPLTISGGASSLRINPPRRVSTPPPGTTADRLDYLLDRGRYAAPPEAPIPRSPSTGARPLATTVTGETPLSVASSAGALDINPAGRRLTDMPSGTTADQLDYLLERGRHAPPGEQPTPTALERANTVRLAGLLSSTTTHLVNATGNLVNGATAIPQQVIASGFDAARVGLRGGSRQRYLGEVLPMIKSWGPGVINSVPDAVEILRTGVSPQNAGKLDHIGAGFRSDLLPVVGRMLGKRGGAIADSAIEMPLRMLQASDVLFRGGATNAFTNSLAVRKALQEGFKGPALERRVGAIMANLDRHPELVKEANDQAARIVFQEKREVPFIGRQAGKALEGSGVLRFAESQILPFTKTPANITAQGMGLSPLGWASVVDAARSGNPGLALDRAARASLGTAAFGVALWMGAHGLLTGAYPDDPQVRSTLPNGWREWSVRLPQPDGGAVYVPMQNFGAFGWPMAMASVATEASSQGKPMDPDQIGKAVTSMGRYVLDNTFLQGLSDATNALHDPERYGQKLLESEASSFVPYSAMGRQLQRMSGMVNRNPREGLQGILDAMAATNPLTAGSVPERTNALGDTVSPTMTGAAAGFLPIRAEVEQDDPTLKILRDNGVGVSTIARAINVPSGSVQLTEAEQEEFKKARGDLIKRYVASETRGPDFAAARTLTARNKYLSDAVQRANQDAREAMITKWAADRSAWRARIEKKAVPEPYYLGGSDGG
jgi:murein DD-endopeptidase MepM/ murein hydrolase activator NlpD